MKIVIALGNIGKEYTNTRHNFGQIVVSNWMKNYNFSKFKIKKDLFAKISENGIDGVKTMIAFPLGFMNNSGQSVLALKNYFCVHNEDIIIVHDDIDIPFGRIKINEGVGSAGHKGVQSVINYLKSKDFVRVRLGIGSIKFAKIPSENYVLQNFSPDEKEHFSIISKMAGEALDMIVKDNKEKAMNMFN